VDDIEYNRFFLKKLIVSNLDLKTTEAGDGQECIEILKAYSEKSCCAGIRLIFMDFEMPILNGIEVLF
jgi:CheY-like chemotaxis protein